MTAAAPRRRQPRLLVFLRGVVYPHKLGAILRSGADFDIRFVLGAVKGLPKLSPAPCRVAVDGDEHVMLVHLHQPQQHSGRVRQSGFEFLTAIAGKGSPHKRHAFRERCVLILGNGCEGINPA